MKLLHYLLATHGDRDGDSDANLYVLFLCRLLMTPMEMKKTKATAVEASSQPGLECCMCGDYGFSVDLFQCVICHFRSQHRYCSNQYPKVGTYRVCNWCLNKKEEAKENSANQSSSSSKSDGHERRNSFPLQPSRPIKKQRPPEGQKKPVIGGAAAEEKLRRTKSADIPVRSMVKRQVFRNKVRRYKLLDEVSS